MVTEMINPCIWNVGENDFFFFFLVSGKSDFVLTKFCMSICTDVLLTEPSCNLHDLYTCIDSDECFYALLIISLFWDIRFYHLSDDMWYNVEMYMPGVHVDSFFCYIWLLNKPDHKIYDTLLTGGNWQKWKRVFLTCPCHEIYRDEAVGLKSCKSTWKITIFVKMWNLGQYRENLIFCQ